jgi:hypothetical protein
MSSNLMDTVRSPGSANVPSWNAGDECLVQRGPTSTTTSGQSQPMMPKPSWTDPASMSWPRLIGIAIRSWPST